MISRALGIAILPAVRLAGKATSKAMVSSGHFMIMDHPAIGIARATRRDIARRSASHADGDTPRPG